MTVIANTIQTVGRTVEDRPKLVAGVLLGIIVFFALACALNDVIPVCHYLFRCDHRFGH
jgi:hypothetical protein